MIQTTAVMTPMTPMTPMPLSKETEPFQGELADDNIHTITIPEVINNKPVTDVAEECFISIRAQSTDWWLSQSILWDVSEDNPYFSVEKYFVDHGANSEYYEKYGVDSDRWFLLYNKDKTTLFYAEVRYTAREKYVLPKNVTKIYNGAFQWVAAPVEIEDGNEHFVVEDNMLFSADKTRLIASANRISSTVLSYKVPDTVTQMDVGVFADLRPENGFNKTYWPDGWDGNISVVLPEGIREIPDYAFFCSYAFPDRLPESVETIASYAFESSNSHKTNALSGENLELIIPKNVKNIGRYAFKTSSALLFRVDENNPYFMTENRVMYTKDKTEIVLGDAGFFYYGHQLPDTVKVIRSGAFELNHFDGKALSVLIPGSVETIEEKGIVFWGWEEHSFIVYGKSGSYVEQYVKDYNTWFFNWVTMGDKKIQQLITFLPLEKYSQGGIIMETSSIF
jgi:hypothetical protein